MILESVVTTQSEDGSVHIAPLGLHVDGAHLIIAPFRPSKTLENLQREGHAVVNWTTDVRLFAGPVTGRRDWPVVALHNGRGHRLTAAHTHAELNVIEIEDDPQRPRFRCAITHEATHTPFRGFVRAQAAVVEAAILVTRLHMLPKEKIESELNYLQIAIDKTAGPIELEAWSWIMQRIQTWRQEA
jgi:uncharacterized protein